MRTKVLTPLLVTAACALGAVPASAAAATDVQQAASENWSGYVASAASGKSFSSVTSSWVQPTASCTSGSGYAAFWVGLGGSGSGSASSSAVSAYGGDPGASTGSGQSEALEQAGTQADCTSSGQASYFAWYELVPAAPVRLGLTITPGDHITTRVGVNGTSVTINLSDATSGQSVTKTLSMSNPDTSSAEWIAEAPSTCGQSATNCSPLPLANFGSVNFTGATATTSDGHTGPISDPAWTATEVALESGASGYGPQFTSDTSSSAGATPSSLGSNGDSFSVAWSDGGSSTSTGVGVGSAGSAGSAGFGRERLRLLAVAIPGTAMAVAIPGYGYGGGDGYGGGAGYAYGDGYGGGYGGRLRLLQRGPGRLRLHVLRPTGRRRDAAPGALAGKATAWFVFSASVRRRTAARVLGRKAPIWCVFRPRSGFGPRSGHGYGEFSARRSSFFTASTTVWRWRCDSS